MSLTWSAVTAPGAEAVTYYVTRDGGDTRRHLPAPAAPAAVTTCIDSGLDGRHPHLHGDRGLALLERDQRDRVGDRHDRPATHFTIAAATDDARPSAPPTT